MATARQKAAARKNIRKAQQARRTKSARGQATKRPTTGSRTGARTAAGRKTASRKRASRKVTSRKTASRKTASRKTASRKTAARKTAARAKTTSNSKTAARAQSRRARPKARRGAKSGGRGKFFHIEVQPKADFAEFRTHDIGSKGGIERVAGRREGGSWSTQKWLIAKSQAHVEGDNLVGDSADARKVLSLLGSAPRRVRADRFSIHDGARGRASAKPSTAPRRAGLPNVRAPQKGRKWV